MMQDAGGVPAVEIHPAHRHCHHLGPRGLVAAGHFGKTSVLAGAHKQAGIELASGDGELPADHRRAEGFR